MDIAQEFAGTWEEARAYEEAFVRRQVRIQILDEKKVLDVSPAPFTRDDPTVDKPKGHEAPEGKSLKDQRDPALVARVKSIRGMFASTHTGPLLASEELHRERQADKEKEERQIEGYRP